MAKITYILNNNYMYKLFLFFSINILFLFSSFVVSSQEHDFQIWTSLAAEKKITKKFNAELEHEIRIEDNVRQVGTILTDAGISYRLTNWLKVSGNYRFTLKRLDDGFYQDRHRFYCNLHFRHKTNFADYLFRTRYQNQFSDLKRDNYINTDNYIRNKFTFEPKIVQAFVTYISLETYHNLNDDKLYSPTDIRTEAGIEYKVSRRQTFNPYFLFQHELRSNKLEFDYVLGLNYIFSL